MLLSSVLAWTLVCFLGQNRNRKASQTGGQERHRGVQWGGSTQGQISGGLPSGKSAKLWSPVSGVTTGAGGVDS